MKIPTALHPHSRGCRRKKEEMGWEASGQRLTFKY